MVIFSKYRQVFHFVLIATVIIVCYAGSVHNSWHFDDAPNILENENIRIKEFSWEALKKTFYSPTSKKIDRPLSYFSFAINYIISGANTASYHVVNIIIHILNAFFCYLVFVHTLLLFNSSSNMPDRYITIPDVALLGAVFWATHPIQTQAVTYIVQRMASMAAMFYMVSFYCYIKFRTEHNIYLKWLFFLACCSMWLMGMLSKENAALLPLAILVYELVFLRRSLKFSRKSWLLFIASMLVIVLASYFYVGGSVITYFQHSYSLRPFTLWERLITEPIILSRYIFLLFCPVADFLVLDSDIIASSGLLAPPATIAAILFVLALIIFSVGVYRKLPLVSYAIIFYFINHLVESTIFDLELYFEHRNYLPSVFVYLSVSFYIIRLISMYGYKKRLFMRSLVIFAVVFILISQGNATYLRNDIWKDGISLYTDGIDKAPRALRPYTNLAAQYITLGRIDEAVEVQKRAEKLYKKNQDIYQKSGVSVLYYNAGLINFYHRKDTKKAAAQFLKSAELYPAQPQVHYHAGLAFFKLNDLENAKTAAFNYIQLKSNDYRGYNLLGRILYAQGDFDKAIRVFRTGLDVDKNIELQVNLAAAFLKKNNLKGARSALYMVDNNDKSIAYYLANLSLVSREEREDIYRKITRIIVDKHINFCEWKNELIDNNSYPNIFPDVSLYLPDLARVYVEELGRRVESIQMSSGSVLQCISTLNL